jgi:hypothetical protein
LTGGFARLSTRGRGAVALALGAPQVGRKEGPTMLALPCGAWMSHGPASPQAHEQGIGAWKEENGAGQSAPKKIEEYGRRG